MIELTATILSYDVPFQIPLPIEVIPVVVIIIVGVILLGWLILHLLGKAFESLLESGLGTFIVGVILLIISVILLSFFPYVELEVVALVSIMIGTILVVAGGIKILVKRLRRNKNMVKERPSTPRSSPTEQTLQEAVQDLKLRDDQKKFKRVREHKSRNIQLICAGAFLIILGFVQRLLSSSRFAEFLQVFFLIIGIILLAIGIIKILVERSRCNKRMVNEKPSTPQYSPVEQSSTKPNIKKIPCPSCGAFNLKTTVYCESCGYFLNPPK